MSAWHPMPDAPRDGTAVRLDLPGAEFRIVDGRPTEVTDVECIGVFDPSFRGWVIQATGQRVYPSQWQPIGDA